MGAGQGEEIKTLVDRYQNPGEYELIIKLPWAVKNTLCWNFRNF